MFSQAIPPDLSLPEDPEFHLAYTVLSEAVSTASFSILRAPEINSETCAARIVATPKDIVR